MAYSVTVKTIDSAIWKQFNIYVNAEAGNANIYYVLRSALFVRPKWAYVSLEQNCEAYRNQADASTGKTAVGKFLSCWNIQVRARACNTTMPKLCFVVNINL